MTDPKTTLQQLHKNLQILQERAAKHAANAPLDLLNQIEDHQTAIALTRQHLAGDLSESEWREALKPLTVVQNGQVVNIEAGTYIAGDVIHQAPEEPPFWKRLSRLNLVAGLLLALVGTIAAVLAVPEFNEFIFPDPTPTEIPPPSGEPLYYPVSLVDAETDEPIPNITVRIDPGDGEAPLQGVTDSDGFTRIAFDESLKNANTRLIIRAEGYEPYERTIDLKNNSVTAIVRLEKSSSGGNQ